MQKQKHKKCKTCWKEFFPYLSTEKFCTKKCLLESEKQKRAKIREKKSVSPSVLKKKLWETVSEYIRRKDADSDWKVKCVTCWTEKHWKEQQAGHWIPRTYSKYFYDERNIHPQCYACNVRMHSNPIEYRAYMERTYWIDAVEEMLSNRHDLCKRSPQDYMELLNAYREKLSMLG